MSRRAALFGTSKNPPYVTYASSHLLGRDRLCTLFLVSFRGLEVSYKGNLTNHALWHPPPNKPRNVQENSITRLFLLINFLIFSPQIPPSFFLPACYPKMNLLPSSLPSNASEKLGRVAVKFVFLIQKKACSISASNSSLPTKLKLCE